MSRSALKNIARLLKEDTRPVEQCFLDDLKRSIEMTANKDDRLPSQTYKPSGMNCMRQSYYQIKGYEPDKSDTSSALVGICESGTDRHERIQQCVIDMQSNDIDCTYVNVADFVESRNLTDLEIVKRPDFEKGEYETKLYHKKYNISFLCDGIIKYKSKYYILEIKTESSYKFMNRNSVDPSHYNQAIAYSLAFGIDDVLFVYENRDICDKKAYLFNVTDDMRDGLIDYITKCDECLKNNTVPSKSKSMSKKACSYCGYKKYCEVDDDN